MPNKAQNASATQSADKFGGTDPASFTEAERASIDPSMFGDDADVIDSRVESFISMSMLVQNSQWIIENVCAKGAGTQLKLAVLAGVASEHSTQTNEHKGAKLESIKLTGDFEATIESTGEVITAEAAYLPKMWAAKVARALDVAKKDDPNATAQMVLSIGVRATGKTPPYAWTVNTHIRGAVNPQLEALKRTVLPSLTRLSSRVSHLENAGRIIDGRAEQAAD